MNSKLSDYSDQTMAITVRLFLLLAAALCSSVVLAGPVFFPEEVSDYYFTVLPSYFKFSFEAADSPSVSAATGSASGVSGVAQHENADKNKLGEKALVDDDAKVTPGPGFLVNSDELDDSASDEAGENSTEPVKKLLVRTFTDLHPKVALELTNKTMIIANATDFEKAKQQDDDDVVVTTTEVQSVADSTTITPVETTKETTNNSAVSTTESPSTTSELTSTSSSSSTTVAASSSSPFTESTTTTEKAKEESPSTTPKVTSPAETSSTTPAPVTESIKEKEKDLEEIQAEIEADPVILTQGV